MNARRNDRKRMTRSILERPTRLRFFFKDSGMFTLGELVDLFERRCALCMMASRDPFKIDGLRAATMACKILLRRERNAGRYLREAAQ